MRRDTLSRRSVLGAAAGFTLASASAASVVGGAIQNEGGNVSRDTVVIREGTAEETTAYVVTADTEGPTALVVGGMHGNETAGYTAAGQIADWTIDAGTLVVIPEANAVAIEGGTRNDEEGNNLNRQFSQGETPGTELARDIWNVVSEYDPDIMIDLHESTGIYADDPMDGVGQAIFRSSGTEATNAAADAVDYINRDYIEDSNLAFQTGPFSLPGTDPSGLLAHKAARDLDADGFLVETLSTGVELQTRVQWHTAIVERLLEDELLLDDSGSGSTPDEPVDDEPAESESESEEPAESESESEEPAESEPESEEPAESESEPEEPVDDDADDEAEAASNEDGDEASDDGESAGNESPTAQIDVRPAWVNETALKPGQTITLDASGSSDPDGELVDYEWCIDKGASFDKTGETIEVTIGSPGEHPVTLRIVGDDGSTDTTQITLETNC
ncbi:succinylglutamate desuccinylase/aspartoacylase family protein [Natrinema zhouii]|uniref:Succinylglutamate desuccinylase/aspartoacylase family protein n=1 Tax=Natrinema zhouii TaxID=1710539 RepID=A0A7D6GZE9_9EURY|nr:succinylglutamate desuccinylase/aspartoacylase family protein [Natrinema zhouii]QLK25805.1 succinylglutamate desuccinylase/aspartoacylase family protein [Natrinema zhouii]